ncbi:MAG: efflux RND transporter periplasmic adaptor subunit [Spirochaetes bacterium]|nr:efflux RND transporter periplasmic adaptor subunit [Spirochaetota bacterium]
MKQLFNQWIQIIIVILILNILITCKDAVAEEKSVADTDSISVQLIQVKEREIYPSIRTIGNIVQKEKADITSLVSGRVHTIYKDTQDVVEKGDVLAILDQQFAEISLKQAKNNYQSAKNALTSANLSYEEKLKEIEVYYLNVEKLKAELEDRRNNIEQIETEISKNEELYKIGGVTKDQLDKLKYNYLTIKKDYFVTAKDLAISEIGYRDKDIIIAGYKVPKTQEKKLKILQTINTRTSRLAIEEAKTNLKKAELELQTAQINYDETFIRSPIDGVIGERFIHIGERVDEKTKLYTIIDTDEIYWIVNITEMDASKILIGNKCTFRVDALENQEFTGTVDIISPLVDIKSRTIEVRIGVNNKKNLLRPGMFARGNIISDAKKKELRIPVTTLATVNDTNASVFVVKKNRVFQRKIVIGNEENDYGEVFEGLLPNEIIVDNPPINLMEGMNVTENKENL